MYFSIGFNVKVIFSLVTGRYHQIRIQFANIKHPLYGDFLYNKKDSNPLALVSYSLSFIHPVTKSMSTKERLFFSLITL